MATRYVQSSLEYGLTLLTIENHPARRSLHPTRTFYAANRFLNLQSDVHDTDLNSSLQDIRGIEAVINGVAAETKKLAEQPQDEAEEARLKAQQIAADFVEFQRLSTIKRRAEDC